MTVTQHYTMQRNMTPEKIVALKYSGVDNVYTVVVVNRKTNAAKTETFDGYWAAADRYDYLLHHVKPSARKSLLARLFGSRNA